MKKFISMALIMTTLMLAVVPIYANPAEKTALEVGDTVYVGNYRNTPIAYRVMGSRDVNGDGEEELFLAAKEVISFKEMNGVSTKYLSWKMNNKQNKNHLREWLNSTAEVIDYTQNGDSEPKYKDQPGFLSPVNMDAIEYNAIVPVTHKSIVSLESAPLDSAWAPDGGSVDFGYTYQGVWPANFTETTMDTAYYHESTDLVFVPSMQDIYDYFGGADLSDVDRNMSVGATDVAKEEADAPDKYNYSNIYLRDEIATKTTASGHSRYYVWAKGGKIATTYTAQNQFGVLPCMYLKPDTVIEESTTPGVYQIKLPMRKEIKVTQFGARLTEVQAGEIQVTGSVRAEGKEAYVTAALYRIDENKNEILEDYKSEPISDHIAITLSAAESGNRFVTVFVQDENGVEIGLPEFFGTESADIWQEAEPTETIEAETEVEGNIIRIRGTVPSDCGRTLNVLIQKRTSGAVGFAKQIPTSTKNGFMLSCPIENLFGGTPGEMADGWYDIRMVTENASGNFQAVIAGEGVWLGVLEKINACDKEYVTNVFLNKPGYEVEYSSVTDKGLFLTEYKDNEEVLSDALDRLFANKPGAGYTTEGIAEPFNRFMTYAYFNNTKNKFPIVEQEKYSKILGIEDLVKTETFLEISRKGLIDVFDGVTAENVKEKLPDNMIIVSVNDAENATAARKLIEQYAGKIGITFAGDYYSLSATKLKKLYDQLLGKNFGSLAAIRDAFYAAYAAVCAETPTGGGTGGGGGGISGGSGKSTYISATGTTQSTVPDNSCDESQTVLPFSDIADLTWGKEAIIALSKKGIINGNEKGEFLPFGNLTREQFAKIAALTFGIAPKEVTRFQDVEANSWYSGYVGALCEKGYIKGVSDTVFGTGEAITRQDMAVILFRILQGLGRVTGGAEIAFQDEAEIADYAKEAVKALAGMQIINGYEDGSCRPNNLVTRQEAAQIIYRIAGGAK